MTRGQRFIRQDLLELASAYAEYSVLVTTAELDLPGPQILYANSAFTRMTGYSVSELLGKTPRILQGAKTDRKVLNRLRETLTQGQDFVGRAINYRRDGTPFELEWIISHLRDSDGNTTHYIALQRDVTGQERAAAQLTRFDDELRDASIELQQTFHRLQQAEQRLLDRERFAALGEIAAGVVHDISNALTPMFSLVRFLHAMDNMPPEARPLTAHLDVAIEYTLQILSNLKQYHHNSESGHLQSVDLQSLVRRIPDLTRSRWWSRTRQSGEDVRFALEIENVGPVLGNEVELTQVLTNLVLNAIDAIPDGGTITLHLSRDDSHAIMRVSDTGQGMSPELMAQCFDPYVTNRSSGSGIGLSVCRRIVEQHQGTIYVTSAQPQGVTFTVRLPLLPPQDTSTRHADVNAGTETNTTAPDRSGTRRVLQISPDGEEGARIRQQLQASGLVVDTVASGDEGLSRFYATKYVLVIADSSLRPTSGFEIAQTVKRTSPQTPVAVSVSAAQQATLHTLPDHLRPDIILSAPTSRGDLNNALKSLGLLSGH